MDKPKCWVKKCKVKVEVGLIFEITFLTQHLGSNNPAFFRVQNIKVNSVASCIKLLKLVIQIKK